MPVTPTSRTDQQPDAAPRPRLQLSATQLLASALAAVTATLIGSYLGVTGTVVGAAVASVATVAGNAVYLHSFNRTRARVRGALPVRHAPTPVADPPPARSRPVSMRMLAAACAGVFVAVLAVVTGAELVAGQPLSDLVRHKSAQGTTVFGTTEHQPRRVQPAAPAVTVTASVVVKTPTVTRTAPAVTQTATPTVTVTPTPATRPPTGTATPTPAPTPPPPSSASVTPGPSAR